MQKLFFLFFFVFLLCPVQSLAEHTEDASARPPKTIRVGVLSHMPPLSFVNSNSELRGLAVDLAVMLGNVMKSQVSFRTGSRSELFTMLERGTIDYICALPQDMIPENRETLLLVTSFAVNRRILIAKQGIHVTCEQDYPQRTLVLLEGDRYAELAEKAGGKVVFRPGYAESLQLLRSGGADAFVAPSGEIASYLAQQAGYEDLAIMGLSLERLPLVIIMGQQHAAWMPSLADALNTLENVGTLNALREKWLGKRITLDPSFWETYRRPFTMAAGISLLILLTVIFWNLTLRRQVNRVTRQFKNSEKRYRELIEASPDLVFLLDEDGAVQLANRIARQTLNCGIHSCGPDSEALLMALSPEDRARLFLLLANISPGETRSAEFTFFAESKNPLLYEFLAFPTSSSHPGTPLVCCLARDMTKRVIMEKELVQVERLAVIGQLAAGVAHEINNPLGIILSNAELMAELCEDDLVQPRIQAIQRNVERAAVITRRLLHLAVPTTATLGQTDLAIIVDEALGFLKPKMKSVQVNLEKLAHPLPVLGDKALLEQLIINLLLNALDAMGGTGSLSISSATFQGEDADTIRLAIHDTGKGIPKENLEKVFDIFFTTRGAQGFGLGLFVSRRIAEQHGGILFAESECGKGTSMYLELPAVLGAKPEASVLEFASIEL